MKINLTKKLTTRGIYNRIKWTAITTYSLFFVSWILSYLFFPERLLAGYLEAVLPDFMEESEITQY
ncbi:hypothetical protein BEH94_07545 [Candidatus Altiarchaeales archaeon WOR_SM1_SCG]|nr:hypothetical protein BEH94_07545 [Candidatus Altiarchaeales archaeon WOR_SM1_SCG]